MCDEKKGRRRKGICCDFGPFSIVEFCYISRHLCDWYMVLFLCCCASNGIEKRGDGVL